MMKEDKVDKEDKGDKGGGADKVKEVERTPFSEAKEAIKKTGGDHLVKPEEKVRRADYGKRRGPLKNFKRKDQIEAELREANETIGRLKGEIENLNEELSRVREAARAVEERDMSTVRGMDTVDKGRVERSKRGKDLFPGGFTIYIEERARRMGFPPPPEKERLMGDKSPDYKLWAEKYFPEESKLRYKHLYRVYKEGADLKPEKEKVQTVHHGIQEAYRIRLR